MQPPHLALGVIILAGSLAAIQAPMNAALGKNLGSPIGAALVSFGVGFITLLVIMLFSGTSFHLTQVMTSNRWLLIGGVFGAFYVWAILWVVPTLGIVTAISAMIFGQIIVALALDATGLFGLPPQALTWPRLCGAGLVAFGLVLTKL